MKVYLYAYNSGSEGAKALTQALNIKRIKREKSKFRGGPGKVVINWGSATLPDQVAACEVLNKPQAVNNACDKLKSFELFKKAGVSIPPFFTKKEEADEYFRENPERPIVCRTKLRGHSGAGIVIAEDVGALVDAPLYTAYVNKKEEYRYHVFNGEVVDVQRKARKKEVPDDQVNWKVRNLDGGFIFAREGVVVSPVASEEAVKAVSALGLDFGAVDIIWNQKEDKYYALEVNTAPGLTGTTLEGYAKRIGDLYA